MHLKLTSILATASSLLLICSCRDDSPVDSSSVVAEVPQELFDVSHVLSSDEVLVPAGSMTSTKETRSIINASINIEVRDQKMSGITTRVFERAYVSDYLSSENIRTEFKKDIVTSRATIGGRPAPQPNQTAPLHQQTIIFTKSGNQWVGVLDGPKANPGQLERIEELARLVANYNNRVILGSVPRKVGESWEINAVKLNTFAGGLGEMDGTFKVFFRSLVMHDGYICAEIMANFDLVGSEVAGKEMRIRGRAKLLQSLDYHILLSMQMDGEITMANPIMNGTGEMRTKGRVELARDTTLVRP